VLEILLVEDEPSLRTTVQEVLVAAGHKVTPAADGAQARALLTNRVYDAVITDIRLPKVDGMTLFRQVLEQRRGTEVILMTAYATVEEAVAALHDGAYHYLVKPFSRDELVLHVGRIAERRALHMELASARAALGGGGATVPIIGRSPAMLRVIERTQTLAQSDSPVLLLGESGTGKELVARTLHDLSPRGKGPFVAVNCAAFPDTLLEAELFGHERGAFTGAVKKRDGRFRAADGGTLLLDEVAELPPAAQAKLLRVLQEGAFEPLGTNTTVRVDVRIVSATHRNLKDLIAASRFREDLYYRLNVLDIVLPPLRERRADLPMLVQHFLRRLAEPGQHVPSISPRAWAALADYDFPGNVRELAHAVEHAVVLAGGREIDLEHLPRDIAGAAPPAGEPRPEAVRPLADAAQEFEREYLRRALTLTGGKRIQAAKLLGISRRNLWAKLRAHALNDAELDPREE
jgi:two-component system response regulator AtoC